MGDAYLRRAERDGLLDADAWETYSRALSRTEGVGAHHDHPRTPWDAVIADGVGARDTDALPRYMGGAYLGMQGPRGPMCSAIIGAAWEVQHPRDAVERATLESQLAAYISEHGPILCVRVSSAQARGKAARYPYWGAVRYRIIVRQRDGKPSAVAEERASSDRRSQRLAESDAVDIALAESRIVIRSGRGRLGIHDLRWLATRVAGAWRLPSEAADGQ